ncbi:MAG: hypothetical protein K2X77_10490 [Candidatus Obscuribacterales bacterium]|jgi:hypothetical protein|nr:hypothetical protein [Candidatus Obscuribacterales bacterium]
MAEISEDRKRDTPEQTTDADGAQKKEGENVEHSQDQTTKKSSPWSDISNEILNARIRGALEASKQTDHNDPVLKALKKEIVFHEQSDKSTSYLGKIFDYVYSKDQKSLQELKTLYEDYGQAQVKGNAEEMAAMQKKIQEKIAEDMKNVGFQEEIKQMGGTFTKMMFLFVQGGVGIAGTVGSYALDQAKPADPLMTQATDATLGAAKGLAMRQLVQVLGQTELPLAVKGVLMGATNRLLDQTLTRETWQDKDGDFAPGKGVSTALLSTFDPKAMLLDAAILSAATALTAGVNAGTNDILKRSPFLQMVAGGYIFGSTAGGLQELGRQQGTGEKIDVSKILLESQKIGLLTGLAATVGGLQADAVLRKQIREAFSTPKPAVTLDKADIQKIWDGNSKSLVSKGYFEVKREIVNPEQFPKGKVYSTTEAQMILQKDVTVPGQFGADGKPLVLKAGTVLPNGVQFAPQEIVPQGKTVDGDPIRVLSKPQIITPEKGVKLADGTVLKSGNVSEITVASGQEAKPGSVMIVRDSVDYKTGAARIDTYHENPEKFAKMWKEVPGKPGVYSPNMEHFKTPMEVVQVPDGVVFRFKPSYDPDGPWVYAKPGDLIKQSFSAEGKFQGFYRISAQDALETHIPKNAQTAARMDLLTKEIYQRSGAIVTRAQIGGSSVLSPFLSGALEQVRKNQTTPPQT